MVATEDTPKHQACSYDLADIDERTREALDEQLEAKDVKRVWKEAVVTISSADENVFEEVIDEVLQNAPKPLDPDRDRVVYEVGGWSKSTEDHLVAALNKREIDYEFNADGDVVLYKDDEDRAELLLDEMDAQGMFDVEEESEQDDLVVQETMSSLWIALKDYSADHKKLDARVAVTTHAEKLEGLDIPFGLDEAKWKRMQLDAHRIAFHISGTEEIDADEHQKMVERLREQLRSMI